MASLDRDRQLASLEKLYWGTVFAIALITGAIGSTWSQDQAKEEGNQSMAARSKCNVCSTEQSQLKTQKWGAANSNLQRNFALQPSTFACSWFTGMARDEPTQQENRTRPGHRQVWCEKTWQRAADCWFEIGAEGDPAGDV